MQDLKPEIGKQVRLEQQEFDVTNAQATNNFAPRSLYNRKAANLVVLHTLEGLQDQFITIDANNLTTNDRVYKFFIFLISALTG